MEVKNPKAAYLSNHEVLHLLKDLKESRQEQHTTPNINLGTIFYETSHYLQDSGFNVQTSSMIKNVMTALRDFPVAFTKEEKLMMINHPPTTNLQLSLIVRDADERMTEEQMKDLLDMLQKYFYLEDKA